MQNRKARSKCMEHFSYHIKKVMLILLMLFALSACTLLPNIPMGEDVDERNAIWEAFLEQYEGSENLVWGVYTAGNYHDITVSDILDTSEQDLILEILTNIQQDSTINTSDRPMVVSFYKKDSLLRREILE